jgi:hypothetical protein
MKTLKAETFNGWHPLQELLEFVAKNNIDREDIFTITQAGGYFTLFYYAS